MRFGLLTLGLWLSASICTVESATLPHYINTAPLNGRTPNIDAVSFENRSDFSVGTGSSFFPYQFFNTLHFTNTTLGTMSATPGFWFDHAYVGGRGPASNFVNRGLISASSTIWVDAQNIVNSGQGLVAGARGAILLSGKNVNLSRSGIFVGDSGLLAGIDTSSLADPIDDRDEPFQLIARAFSQPRVRDNNGAFTRSNSIPKAGIPDPSGVGIASYVFTNRVDSTNFIQAVFVPTNALANGVSIDVRFLPGNVGNGSVVSIEVSAPEFNIVDGTVQTNYFYLEDWLGFEDDIFHLAKNLTSAAYEPAQTSRPNNYATRRVAGTQDANFLTGSVSNFTFDSQLFTGADYLSNNVARRITGYGGRLILGENLYRRTVQTAADRPWNGLPIEDATNFAGRVEVKADRLNLDQVRLRANSAVILKTPDLVGNRLPIVDAPLVSYDVKSTQSTLTASNLISPTVTRMLGNFSVNSAIWLNASTNGGATNFYYFHTVVFDHSITTTQTVLVQDLHLKAPSVVLSDKATVTRSFKVEADSFTITPTGFLTNGTSADLGATNLIGVMNFTNSGNLVINRELRLGSDRATGYANIINQSNLTAGSMFLKGDRIANVGLLQTTQGSLDVNGGLVDLSASNSIVSVGEIALRGKSLIASNSQVTATTGGLVIDFVDSAVDAGNSSSNFWRVSDGFSINRVAKTNDLFGTTIISTAGNFREVAHYSAVPDLGVSPDGYDNNMAIGRLVLDGGTNSFFRFSPGATGTNRALYVDYLELTNFATNYTDAIGVDEGMTLYFADSNIDPSLLNHLQSDRIRWVSSFGGPLSGTNVVYTGGTYTLNRRLVLRNDLDSDNDGVANNADSTPVWIPDETANITIGTTNLPPVRPLIVFNGLLSQSNVTYVNFVTNVVEYTGSLTSGEWLVLTNIASPLGPPQFDVMRVIDNTTSNRFYRVRTHVQDP